MDLTISSSNNANLQSPHDFFMKTRESKQFSVSWNPLNPDLTGQSPGDFSIDPRLMHSSRLGTSFSKGSSSFSTKGTSFSTMGVRNSIALLSTQLGENHPYPQTSPRRSPRAPPTPTSNNDDNLYSFNKFEVESFSS